MNLTNKEFNIEGNWYAPQRFLEDQKNVLSVELIDTTSSAGDWSGVIFKKIRKDIVMIPFNQDNNYPGSGFTLYTGEPAIVLKNTQELTEELKQNLIQNHVDIYYS